MHFWPPSALTLALYLLFINALALGMYAFDKQRARDGGWRVKENHLLLIAFLGGSPGSLFAQKYLKHKTRKQPFQGVFRMIMALQLMALFVVIFIRSF